MNVDLFWRLYSKFWICKSKHVRPRCCEPKNVFKTYKKQTQWFPAEKEDSSNTSFSFFKSKEKKKPIIILWIRYSTCVSPLEKTQICTIGVSGGVWVYTYTYASVIVLENLRKTSTFNVREKKVQNENNNNALSKADLVVVFLMSASEVQTLLDTHP